MPPATSLRILLVEDHIRLAEELQSALESSDCRSRR